MVNPRSTLRKFICKRCKKPSTDKMGGFERYDSKNDVKIIYENIDLCNRCFKITKKESTQLAIVQELVQKKILNSEDKIKQFQTDKQFRNMLVKRFFVANGKNTLGERRKQYVENLKRSQNAENGFRVLFQ